MEIEGFRFSAADTVQCPRCGNMREIPLSENTGRALMYAGVCQSAVESGGLCGTSLRLEVTAHAFPARVGSG